MLTEVQSRPLRCVVSAGGRDEPDCLTDLTVSGIAEVRPTAPLGL
jgi:hypothetical protein